MSDAKHLTYDACCVAIGCKRPASSYAVWYDHRECPNARSEVLLVPTCSLHDAGVMSNMQGVHFQCMGWDVSPEDVRALFAFKEYPR